MGKYDALDESAVKGMFERHFFGTYKCLAKMEAHTSYLWRLTLYGNKLLSGSDDRTIRVWEADTHEYAQAPGYLGRAC
jgi:WD40 repeat protein